MAWKYNPKTNRWEDGGTPPPTTEKPWDPVRGNYGPQTTTTTVPKQAGTTQGAKKGYKPVAPVRPKRGQFPGAIENQPIDTTQAVNDALKDSDGSALLRLLLAENNGQPSRKQLRKEQLEDEARMRKQQRKDEARLRQQRIDAAKAMGVQTTDLANQFFGNQSTQANKAINDATTELLANLGQPTAYNNLPLISVPPALQGLQQNLLSYGATGQDAAGQAAQDQQISDMYSALAKRSAQQLGAADTAYFDALRRSALGAQTAGRTGVAQNIADLQNQVLMANIQALLNASQ